MVRNQRQYTPIYRLHKGSGQAVVVLNGRAVYLGKFDTPSSYQRYDRVIAEWLANGRRNDPDDAHARTLDEVILAYWTFAEGYYVKNGSPTSELASIKEALRLLRRLYGDTIAAEFGPLALEACQQEMIRRDLARSVINGRVGRIRRLFKWAVSRELVPPEVLQGLQSVSGLKRGRSAARDPEPIRPVPDQHIEVALDHLLPAVAAMVKLQLLTAMRPGEARLMRACDIDMRGSIWEYRPNVHKGEHLDRERVIFLGPKAQATIRPFLRASVDAYLFSPKMAVEVHNAKRREERQSPMTPSQRQRRPKSSPNRAPGDLYSKEAYRRAIHRACKEAGVPPWHPHQLRHNAATRVRSEHGLEGAQVTLGHKRANVTEIYAERDRDLARAISAQQG